MSTIEAVGLQSGDKNPDDLGRLIPAELAAEPESLPAVTAAMIELSQKAKGGDKLLRELAKKGIFIWLDGEAEGFTGLGIHAKREHGRDHEAYVRAVLSEGVIEHVDMSWANGAGAWPLATERGSPPPVELIATLQDIAGVKETMDRTAEEVRISRSKIWYGHRTSHPAYRTHMPD